MRTYIYLLFVLLMWGCTTSSEKLEPYVGMDLQEVVADYGYPDVAFDMEYGRRDFLWTMKQSSSMPAYAISPAALTDPVEQFDPDMKGKSITPAYGGQTIAAECSYILMTQWDESKKTWIVSAYQKPKSGC